METAMRTRDVSRSSLVAAGLLALALFQAAEQYLRAVIGRNDLWADAANVWLPLAEHVAAGNPLYVGAAVDNKPPLFQYLNLAVYETGEYVLVFYLLVGLANGLAAWLLYQWVSDFARRETAAIAAVLFLAALPVVNGTIINVRSFALVFVLLAVRARPAAAQGAFIAVAGLFSQYAVFGIPVLLYQRYAADALGWRSFARFCGAGLVVVALAFAPLLWWGVDSLVGGVEWSFFAVKDHLTQNDVLNPWLSPVDWVGKIAAVSVPLVYLLVPAALYAGRVVLGRTGGRRRAVDVALVAFVGVYGLSFAVKSLRYYWMLLLPFLAALAALEVESLYRRAAGRL